jgi:hypothetical protein
MMRRYLEIIAAHEYVENKRKENEEVVLPQVLGPKDWGYKLQTGLIPNSTDLPR